MLFSGGVVCSVPSVTAGLRDPSHFVSIVDTKALKHPGRRLWFDWMQFTWCMPPRSLQELQTAAVSLRKSFPGYNSSQPSSEEVSSCEGAGKKTTRVFRSP